MPGTPLMARSSGVTTAFTQVSALAPVYLVVTVTSGGAISGNWVTGSCESEISPRKVISNEITIDKIGRRIKLAVMGWINWLVKVVEAGCADQRAAR